MPPLIESDSPATWQELEAQVGRILRECGFEVELQKALPLARGEVNVDVYALERTSPPNVVIVECKNWAAAVNKNVVHAFRSVVGDSGANIGLLVSAGGFHSGAHGAAQYTNVRLLDWAEFQRRYVERWYRTFFGDRLRDEANPLIEYTEPINSRIARKENALPEDRRRRAHELRVRYWPLAMAIDHLRVPFLFAPFGGSLDLPSLPLRPAVSEDAADDLPHDLLDATALRPLLEAIATHCRPAIVEFDAVFGERA